MGYQDEKGNVFNEFNEFFQEDGLSELEGIMGFLKLFNPIEEAEIYLAVQAKTTIAKEGGNLKSVMPFGLQGVYNTTSGYSDRRITPLDTYFNLGSKTYWTDLRVMPGQANFQSGELVAGRMLFTMPYLSRGPFKVQLDITSRDMTNLRFSNMTIGSRGVLESPIPLKVPFSNTSFSVESSFGLRLKINPMAFIKRSQRP